MESIDIRWGLEDVGLVLLDAGQRTRAMRWPQHALVVPPVVDGLGHDAELLAKSTRGWNAAQRVQFRVRAPGGLVRELSVILVHVRDGLPHPLPALCLAALVPRLELHGAALKGVVAQPDASVDEGQRLDEVRVL